MEPIAIEEQNDDHHEMKKGSQYENDGREVTTINKLGHQ
jgi:hypothetical protein